MTRPDQALKEVLQKQIDTATDEQLTQLLTDIEGLGAPKQPNHFGTKAIQ